MNWVRLARHAAAVCQDLSAPATIPTTIGHLRTLALRIADPRNLAKRAHLAPAILGVAIWMGFPTVVAQQDMTAMITGADANAMRWNAFVQKSVAGSVQAADMAFLDKTMRGASLAGAGVEVSGVGAVAFRAKAQRDALPDESRIVRGDKKGRILHLSPVRPPKAFSAGSVLDRTSSLTRPAFETNERLVFAQPAIRGKELQIAAAFHIKEQRQPASVPTYLADLVTNDSPDILATAYAPAEPDYAKASPFESLLNEEPEMSGRFIPPMSKGDHAWMKQPLPASVFSEREQQCLANAIYFEARGESPRGQAAVAQVVLNRVRNPTYPNSICGVVYQNDGWFNRCQFSFACDGRKDVVTNASNYRKAKEIAMAVTAGKVFIPEVGSSTHYYAQYVSPGWARAMNKMTKIGLHIFYRTKNGGWG